MSGEYGWRFEAGPASGVESTPRERGILALNALFHSSLVESTPRERGIHDASLCVIAEGGGINPA